MLDLSLPEFFVTCGSLLLATMLLTEIFDWTDIFSPLDTQLPMVSLGASNAAKVLHPDSRKAREFAINIETREAAVVQLSEPLEWSGYGSQPLAMNMANDGNTVMLTGLWEPEMRPSLRGGPLTDIYDFHSMIFHWGSSDGMGSEHSIDGVDYPLELQLIHVKRGYDSPIDAIVDGAPHGIAIVSIFYQITSSDNEYLDHVVKNLWRTSRPGTSVPVTTFPLDQLFSTFEKNYYSYCGTITRETCNEVCTWIVQLQTNNVSSSQVEKFRSVHLADVPVLLDPRSIHRLNDRDLYYYD